MKFFCDHAELIQQLKSERDGLKVHIGVLNNALDELKKSFAQLASQQRQLAPPPKEVTPADIARTLRVHESQLKHIDLEKLGVQIPETRGK